MHLEDQSLDRTTPDRAILGEAHARASARERAFDSQLAVRSLPEGSSAPLLEVRRDDTVAAFATQHTVSLAPDHPDALWGACNRSELQLWWEGDVSAVTELLDRWVASAAAPLGQTDDWETSLEIEVPSRDSDLVLPLLKHGFAPIGITAIRVSDRAASERAGLEQTGLEQAALAHLQAAGIELRRATLGDSVLLGEMDSELLHHDALHGAVEAREDAAAVLQRGIEERLALDPDWTWLILQQGEAVGYLSLEIGRERHRAKCAPGGDIAYIQAMYLRPTVRGGGIGEAVVNFAHARARQAGFDRMLLGYAALNPRSGPFWCRMGYRPLYTSWQRRPALSRA